MPDTTLTCGALQAGRLRCLQQLNLKHTRLGDEACLSLCEAIEAGHCDHIRAMHLGGGKYTRDGMEVVNDVIKEYEKELRVYF